MATKKQRLAREDIRRAAKKIQAEGNLVTRGTLKDEKITVRDIKREIPEGLTKFKQAEGLKLSPQEQHHSPEALLEVIDQTFSKITEHDPTWDDLWRVTGRTQKVFYAGFKVRSIPEVYRQYRDWLKQRHPDSPNLVRVEAYLERHRNAQMRRSQPVERVRDTKGVRWRKVPGREYGPIVNFEGLAREPTLEQGVVFAFGMLSERLGFSVDYVGTEFPDCEAKRTIEGGRGYQQSVKIEFEHMSRNYLADHHPLDGCNIIVCWENNWPECPLEVIALKDEIRKLKAHHRSSANKA